MIVNKRAGRNIFLVCLLFSLAAAPITCVKLFPPNRLPAEPDEIKARRADHEQNGFYLLDQIASTLPQKPAFAWLPMEDDPKQMGVYRPKSGSIGALLGIERPDDDPSLQAYLAAATPIAEGVHQVLQKPSLLTPPEKDPLTKTSPFLDEARSAQTCRDLIALTLARATLLSNQPDANAQTVLALQDALELTDRLHEASIQMYGWFYESYIMNILSRLQPDDQRQMLKWFIEVQQRERPSRQKTVQDIHNYMKFLDALKKEGQVTRPLEALAYLRYRSLFLKNFDYAFKTAKMDRNAFGRLTKEDPLFAALQSSDYSYPFFDQLYFKTSWDNLVGLSLTVLAIELYYHEHGDFPDALNQLVPDYLDALPSNSLLYTRQATGYNLERPSRKQNNQPVFVRTLQQERTQP